MSVCTFPRKLFLFNTNFPNTRHVSKAEESFNPQAVYRRDADSEPSIGLKDVLEEAASIVVILRLWRVFKIVEEFSAGASDRQYILNLFTRGLVQRLSPRDLSESTQNPLLY